MSRFDEIFHGGPTTIVDLDRLQDKLLFSLPPVRDRYARFFILLVLSTVIAAGGLIGNSTAVIIGAMIVAPLMTPMMAASLSVVTGDGRNVVRSVAIVVVGIAVVTAIAFLMARIVPSTEITPEVKARTAPRLLDLVIALAAGAAGAFALGREDVSDALPGVAIAVSLVPPLAAAGICLAAGDPALAQGALLLFLTNFVAIVLAGVVLLAVMGYPRVALEHANASARRRAVAVILVSVVVVAIPLAGQSYRVAQDEFLNAAAHQAVDQWLVGTGYQLITLTAENDAVQVAIQGQGDVPPISSLLADLGSDTGRTIEVTVTAFPATTVQGSTNP